jgi:hypothetical protein
MNIFTIIFDSIVGFIRRNPLMITIIIMVAIFAPSLFGAALIGLLIGALLLLLIPLFVFWRLYRQTRRIEREGGKAKGGFGDFHTFFDGVGGDNRGGYWNSRRGRGGFGGSSRGFNNTQQNPNEGDVKVYTTSEQPQKRVNDNVGDYVDFEEVKSDK